MNTFGVGDKTSHSILFALRSTQNAHTGWRKENTHFMFNIFFFENRAIYEIMWKNVVEPERLRQPPIVTFIQGGAKRTHIFLNGYICLRFLSLGLPQIKSLRSKTSYSRRSESFHSRRNCNCATRNVSKCDAEL